MNVNELEEFQKRVTKMVIGLKHLPWGGEGTGLGSVQPGGRKALGTCPSSLPVPLRWSSGDRDISHNAWGKNKGQWSQTEMRDVQNGCKASFLPIRTVKKKAAQRGCSISLLGGFKDPTGESPQQPGLFSLLLLEGTCTTDILRSNLGHSVIIIGEHHFLG